MAGTKIAAGSVGTGMWIRLANRKGTELTPAYVRVHEIHPMDIEEGKPGYKIHTEDGEYGHFPASARFELGSEPVVKPAKPAPAPKPAPAAKGPKVSPALRVALAKLAESHNGSLTRDEFGHVDPMVLVAMEQRGWAKVDRSGKERKTDLVELTDEGHKAARSLGLAQEKANA